MWTYIRRGLAIIGMAMVIAVVALLLMHPSNDRDWNNDQAVMPKISFTTDDAVTISNVRNNVYRSTTDYDVRYENRTYNLRDLDSVWYIVEPFSDFKGAAHTFVSFGFGDEYIAISVEIRKEKGETFSAWKGLFHQYEIMYVIGDERDLIKLRSNHRKDDVYVYPVKTTPEKMRTLFVDMLTRAEALRNEPEFYNTLTNTCTTNIVRHINMITEGKVPWDIRVLMPSNSDQLAYELGLLDVPLNEDFSLVRSHYRINEKAEIFADDPAFSQRIRTGLIAEPMR